MESRRFWMTQARHISLYLPLSPHISLYLAHSPLLAPAGLPHAPARRALVRVRVRGPNPKPNPNPNPNQGFHTLSHAEPSVSAAMRALNQKGVRYGYFQTTPMARLLPEAAASGALVAAALEP